MERAPQEPPIPRTSQPRLTISRALRSLKDLCCFPGWRLAGKRKRPSQGSSSSNLIGHPPSSPSPRQRKAVFEPAAPPSPSKSKSKKPFYNKLREWTGDGGHEESLFTRGPAKMVMAHDGTQDYPAVLLSYELSKKLKDSLLARREIRQFRIFYDQKIARIDQELENGRVELWDAEAKLEYVQERIATKENGPTENQKKSLKTLQDKYEKAKEKSAGLDNEKKALQRCLEEMQERQEKVSEEVDAILNNVFTTCGLLPQENMEIDPAPPHPEDDTQLSVLARSSSGSQELMLSSGGNGPQRHAESECRKWRNEVTKAEQRLHDHWQHEDKNFHKYVKNQVNRPNINFAEEFDQMYLQQGMELSMELSRAEEALEAAKMAAQEAGITGNSMEHGSGFSDDTSDGYEDDGIAKWFTEHHHQRVWDWVRRDADPVPEQEPPTQETEERPPSERATDSRQMVPSVLSDLQAPDSPIPGAKYPKWEGSSGSRDTLFDSGSIIAVGEKRRKIDKWSMVARGGKH